MNDTAGKTLGSSSGSGANRDEGTERLYYDEPELDEAEAVILDTMDGGREIVLDRTVFYPEGGGQPCDLGEMGGIALESVREEAGRVVHRLSRPLLASRGASVRLLLDRNRRRDHSEQHSAQHLLSGLLFKNHGIPTLSFHLGSQRSTIDVDAAEFPEALVDEVEAEVNGAIADGLSFALHRCPPEDLASLPLRKRPPEGEEVLRIWEIEGLDFSPCCGTHVGRASELRLFKIHAAERYKGKTRIHFSSGGRALRDYLMLHRSAAAAGRILSAGPEDLAVGAEQLSRKAKDSSAKASRLLSLRAAALADAAGERDPIVLDLSGAGPEGIEEGMRILRARGRRGIVSVSETMTVAVVGRAKEALPASLAEASKGLGGRGGGPVGSLRVSFGDSAAADKFAEIALNTLEFDGKMA